MKKVKSNVTYVFYEDPYMSSQIQVFLVWDTVVAPSYEISSAMNKWNIRYFCIKIFFVLGKKYQKMLNNNTFNWHY